MTFLIIFCGFIVSIIVYLIVIIFFPVLEIDPQVITGSLKPDNKTIPSCRKNIEYSVDGEIIRSWLYLPENKEETSPCIILCNGF